jgi:uncharacterized protein YukE
MSVADAEPVFRCAYRLEQVTEDVSTAAARTAGAYPHDWRGTAGIAYQQRLDETADRLRRMARAYDAAGAALVPYAQALLDAAALEQRAASLQAEAAEADRRAAVAAAALGVDRVVGPCPADGLRAAAGRLLAEAADVERRAAAVCAAALEDEAGRAPAPSAWQKVDRFAGDVVQYGAQTVSGTASLLGSAWHALPGVGSRHSRHEARHELVESAVAAAQIWQIPIDIDHALQDGRPGLALGSVVGMFGPGWGSGRGRHRMRDAGLAHKEAIREADRRAALAGYRSWSQTADDMALNGVDLRNEELRGGHVLERHVAASRDFLRYRNRAGRPRAGTFRDRDTAEHLINLVLREHAASLNDVYALPPGETLPLRSVFPFTTGRVTVQGSSRTIPAHAVTVVLKLDEKGEPLVYTAFPEL